MLPAKPSLANAAGNASNHTAASGPGDSEYGTSVVVSVHLSVRNSALPPTPIDSATSPPAPSASAFGSGFGFGGFLAAAASSGSGGGGGGFFSSASSSGAGLGADFSSLLASSDSGSSAGSASFGVFPFTFPAGVLPFLPPFFFLASADSDTSSTSNATTNASPRTAIVRRGRGSSLAERGGGIR